MNKNKKAIKMGYELDFEYTKEQEDWDDDKEFREKLKDDADSDIE